MPRFFLVMSSKRLKPLLSLIPLKKAVFLLSDLTSVPFLNIGDLEKAGEYLAGCLLVAIE